MLRDNFGFTKFVLWGRSMGAVASLLYTSQKQMKHEIIFQVLDSPFCTFEAIAKHHANYSYKLPDMFVGFGINLLKDQFQSHEFNPFKIDLSKVVSECKVPALFVYCEEDVVIPPENTINIINHFNPNTLFERMLISESHNSFRTKTSLDRMIETVRKYTSQDKIKEKVRHRRGLQEIFSHPRTPKSTNWR